MKRRDIIKRDILEKSLEVFKKNPSSFNILQVAKALNVSNGKIHHHFGSDLWEETMRFGIQQKDSFVITYLAILKNDMLEGLTDKELEQHFKSHLETV